MIALLLALTISIPTQRPGALQPGTGVVTGQLRVEDGSSAAGIRVGAVPTDDPTASSFLAVTETDAAGRFRLTNIPAGRYYIAAGRLNSLRFFPGRATVGEATEIAVEPARIRADVNFTVAGNSARPQDTRSPLNSISSVEFNDFAAISRESNPDRKLKLLLDFEQKYPKSSSKPRVYTELMNLYVTRGDARTAQTYGEKLMGIFPNDVPTLLQVSRNYTLLQIDPKKAVEYAEKAVAITASMKAQSAPPQAGMGRDVWLRYVTSLETGARLNLDWVKKTNAWHQQQFLSLVAPRRPR